MIKLFKNTFFKIILDIVFVAIVLIVGIYDINNKYNVSIFGYDFRIIENRNISPSFKPNDLVIIKETDYNNLKINDMISINYLKYKEIVFITNITGTEVERKFIVKNNELINKEISYKDVQGKVVGFISEFGKVINFLRRYFILIVIIFIGITYLTDINEVK